MSETEAAGGDTLLSSELATTSIESYVGADNMEWATSKGIKSVEDLPKLIGSHRELEKMSSGRVKMPTPESSAEEIRAFYQKTGCPENPEGYEVPPVEGAEAFRNENIENSLKQIAHAEGVSKQAFEHIVKGYYDQLLADTQASREQGETALKQELGAGYDESMTIARRFCEECSDEFRELLDSSGLGNNPIFVKEFINLGKKTASSPIIKGDSSGDTEKGYVPQYATSPEMYASGEDDESKQAREYFIARGHKY